MYDEVCNNMCNVAKKVVARYNKIHNIATIFNVGDKVLKVNIKKNKHLENKFAKKWSTPYTVVRLVNTNLYELENCKGKTLKVPVHKRMLVKFNPDESKELAEEKYTKFLNDINTKTLNENLDKYDEIVKTKEEPKKIVENPKYSDLKPGQWLSSFTIDDFMMKEIEFDVEYKYLQTHYLNFIDTIEKTNMLN